MSCLVDFSLELFASFVSSFGLAVIPARVDTSPGGLNHNGCAYLEAFEVGELDG